MWGTVPTLFSPMSNYYTMFRYAKSFTNEFHALDVVHSLWLRYFNKTGEDMLKLKTSNRWLYKCIRNEYFNQYNKYKKYDEIDLEFHLHNNNVILDIEAEEKNIEIKREIYNIVKQKEANAKKKKNKSYDIEKQYAVFLKIYHFITLEYKNKDIAIELGMSEQLVGYYKNQIINHLEIHMANAWRNPFAGSKLQVTRRVSKKTWEEKVDHSEYEYDDANEYYELFRHIESGEGLLVRLPEQKTNPYIK